MPERLDKILAAQGLGSRKEVARLVKSGGVTVNGAPVKDAALKLNPETDRIRVEGRVLVYRKYLYVMLHKPAGVVSATEDSREHTVLDLLPPEFRRRGLSPAGRLDKDTTGLLLLSDDGAFIHRVISPGSHVWKRYEARTARPVRPEDVAAFAAGVEEGGERFAPARLWEENGLAVVEIREGKYHQVKRMFRAVGNEVLALHRRAIGELVLDDTLEPGACRLLTEEERESCEKSRALDG